MGMTIRPLLWATLSVWLVAGTVGGRGAVAAGADDADLRGTSRVAGKPAANAVVWLDAPGAPRATGSTIALEQRNMAFFPRVLAAQVGTVVELPNHDRVFHNSVHRRQAIRSRALPNRRDEADHVPGAGARFSIVSPGRCPCDGHDLVAAQPPRAAAHIAYFFAGVDASARNGCGSLCTMPSLGSSRLELLVCGTPFARLNETDRWRRRRVQFLFL